MSIEFYGGSYDGFEPCLNDAIGTAVYDLEDIENADLKPMDAEEGVKYVTFKEVLVIAFLLLVAGILFLEATALMGLIIRCYYYIKDLLRM